MKVYTAISILYYMQNGIILFENRLWLKMHILSSRSSLKNGMNDNPIEKIIEYQNLL